MSTQTINSTQTPPPVKKIILHNIQSLPSAEIELAPRGSMTVIIGVSDSGKTTLASRALRKLFFNDIPTKEIVRRKCKSASIAAVYDTPDNLTVSWCWKGRNTDAGKAWWEVARDGIDGQEKPETVILEGGGRQGHVPEAIQEITGVRPVVIGGTTLNFNFNKQLDGPFLGDKSPNERYRVLGILAGTLEVDAALKEVGTELIRGRKQETVLDKEITALEEEVKGYDWLEVLGGDIEKVEAAVAEIGRKQGLRDKLVELGTDINSVQIKFYTSSMFAENLASFIKNAEDGLLCVENNLMTYQKLTTANTNINAQKEILSRAEETIKSTDRTTEAQNILTQTETKHTLSGKLISLSNQIVQSSAQLITAQKVITDTEAAPEISTALTTMADKNNTLSALKRLQKDIQSEAAKVAYANMILKATESHKKAAERLDGLSMSNHTRSLLMTSQAGITKCVEAIKGYAEIVALTAGVEEGKEVLSGVETAIPKAKKLRELEKEISSLEWDMDVAGKVLAATEGVGRGNEILSQIEAKAAKLGKLQLLPGRIKWEWGTFDLAEKDIFNLNHDIEVDTREYRELLLKAGICEGCPVVGEVLAAVG